LGGDLYGSRNGAVTPNQYSALIQTYPGVIDALVLGQRHLAPTDVRYFNLSKIVLLTDGKWSQTDVDNFVAWLEPRGIASLRYDIYAGLIDTEEPIKRPVNVTVRVYCSITSDLVSVQSAVEKAVQNLLTPRRSSIDKPLMLSDLYDVIRGTYPALIDYVAIDSPLQDTFTKIVNLTKGSTVVNSTGGNLTTNMYTYYITATDGTNETAPLAVTGYVATAISGTASIKINFTAPQADSSLSWRIYGRLATGAVGLLATVTGATRTRTDTGAVTPNAAIKPPSLNSFKSQYITLGDLSVTVDYTNRRL
jgi:hypothetical protein